jgi:hypothetical protein
MTRTVDVLSPEQVRGKERQLLNQRLMELKSVALLPRHTGERAVCKYDGLEDFVEGTAVGLVFVVGTDTDGGEVIDKGELVDHEVCPRCHNLVDFCPGDRCDEHSLSRMGNFQF